MKRSASRVWSIRTVDDHTLDRLLFSNRDQSSFTFSPDRFKLTIDVDQITRRYGELDSISVQLPPQWTSEPARAIIPSERESTISWTIIPAGTPTGTMLESRVVAQRGGRVVWDAPVKIAITLEGYSQFDPTRHAFPFANRESALGKVRPRTSVFGRTYRLSVRPAAFYHGLYRSIVFIGSDEPGSYRGGLCTGMARAALERSLAGDESEPDLATIMLWHGRQLTDRALLSSFPWFIAPSPRRAYHYVRDLMLAGKPVDVCFDIAVPRPWRKDIVSALMRQGHTVVPYGFRQENEQRAEMLVYDPNHPDTSQSERSVILFDLDKDSYGYRSLATLDDTSITIIAAPQSAYRNGRTAILASLVNLALYPSANVKRGAIGLVAILGALILIPLGKKSSRR